MKNYKVIAKINFDDLEESDKEKMHRKANESIWNCTKERYEYLYEHNAVELIGIDKIESKEKPKKTTKKK